MPPRGSARTMTSPRPAYSPSSAASRRPASCRSRKRVAISSSVCRVTKPRIARARFVFPRRRGRGLCDSRGHQSLEDVVPEKETLERAREDAREGKAPSTQAGEFVREEMHHVREGKHGAKSTKQAIAIGLSKARRSGVKLAPPPRGSKRTKQQAARETAKAKSGGRKKVSATRSRAVRGALKRESRATASRKALARQARSAAARRTQAARSISARRVVRTKGHRGRSAAARKAARTRARGV